MEGERKEQQEAAAGVKAEGAPTRQGVPIAPFVEDVAKFVADQDPDTVLRTLEERLQQYKMVEMKLLAQKRDLEAKLPDLRKSLEVVKRLEQHSSSGSQEDVVADFEVAEGIYTCARIQPASSVCLWLGANVMLEYPFNEALELLNGNFANATISLKALDKDLDFLRDQMNTTEVTVARVHNWNVQRRMASAAMS